MSELPKRPETRPYENDFEIIPDAMSRFEAVRDEVAFFLDSYAHDIAEQGHADFAKSMCMDLVNMLVSTYNDLDRQHLRAV